MRWSLRRTHLIRISRARKQIQANSLAFTRVRGFGWGDRASDATILPYMEQRDFLAFRRTSLSLLGALFASGRLRDTRPIVASTQFRKRMQSRLSPIAWYAGTG